MKIIQCVTNSTYQSPSIECNSRSTNQELTIPCGALFLFSGARSGPDAERYERSSQSALSSGGHALICVGVVEAISSRED
jgi:hypothetical protein